MSNLQSHYHFKLNFQKVDQHTGGKWLIPGTKHREEESDAKPGTPLNILVENLNMFRSYDNYINYTS